MRTAAARPAATAADAGKVRGGTEAHPRARCTRLPQRRRRYPSRPAATANAASATANPPKAVAARVDARRAVSRPTAAAHVGHHPIVADAPPHPPIAATAIAAAVAATAHAVHPVNDVPIEPHHGRANVRAAARD